MSPQKRHSRVHATSIFLVLLYSAFAMTGALAADSFKVSLADNGASAGESYVQYRDQKKKKKKIKNQWKDYSNEVSYKQDPDLHKNIFEGIVPDPEPLIIYDDLPYAKFEFLRTGASTCGKYLYAKLTVPPGKGPPPHIHHWTDEWFYAPDGGAVMFQGQTKYTDIDNPPNISGKDLVEFRAMEKGYLHYGPRYEIHGYNNASNKPIEMHLIWTPDTPDVSILGYFIEVYAPLFKDSTLDTTFNEMQMVKGVARAREYGMNFSQNFWQFIEDVSFVPPHGDVQLDRLQRLIREGDMPCE